MPFKKGVGVHFYYHGDLASPFYCWGWIKIKYTILQAVALVTPLLPGGFGMFQPGRCVGPEHRKPEVSSEPSTLRVKSGVAEE